MASKLEELINTLFNKLLEFKGNPGLPFDLPNKTDKIKHIAKLLKLIK